MRLLLVTPPMIQLNTPYPATAYLMGFLRLHAAGARARARAGRRLAHAVPAAVLRAALAADGRHPAQRARAAPAGVPRCRPRSPTFSSMRKRYVDTVEPAIRFLQRRDPSLAFRIVGRAFLPEGPALRAPERRLLRRSMAVLDEQLLAAFGTLGTTEQARYLASLYVDDLADVWRLGIDPRFELARYGERLAASATSFDPLHEALTGEPTLVDTTLDELTGELVAQRARCRRPDRAVSRQRLRRIPHGAHDPRAPHQHDPDPRRRLGQHRAALAARSARVRLLRLRDARRRRAPAAEPADAPARRARRRSCARMCAKAREVVLKNDADAA